MAGGSRADVLSTLPELKWKGLRAPCSDASFTFQHDLAEHRYYLIDGAGHDWTGRGPIRLTVQLHFINTLVGNDGEVAWFPTVWQQWFDALIVGTTGALVHPVLGTLKARVASVQGDVKAAVRAGLNVQVQFVETLVDPAAGITFKSPAVDPGAAAKAADAALQALGIEYPTGAPDLSLLDAWDSIKGLAFSAALSLQGKINQVAGTVDGLIDDVKFLDANEAYPAIESLVAFRVGLNDYAETAKKTARPTGTRTLTRDTTLIEFAALVGNTADEVMGLNPSALRSPIVSAGATLTYYTAAE